MAAVVTSIAKTANDGIRIMFGTIAFDASYPTGGEAITPNQLGLDVLQSLMVFPVLGYTFAWDASTTAPKVLAYWVDTTIDGSPQLQVPNTTDLSALTAIPFIAIGR